MIKKTAFIFVIVALSILGGVSADELLDKWIVSGSTFEFQGKDCSVKYYDQIGKISLKIGDDRFQVPLGRCEQRDTISYCFDQLDQDKGEYKDGRAYPGVKLNFKISEPNIKISRSFSTEAPNMNDKVEVDVTVKNTGDVRATNLMLTEYFDPGISIYTTTATPVGSGWRYETFLDPGDKRTFMYSFKPTAMIDYDSVVYATYSYPGGDGETESDTITVNVETPIDVSHNLSLDSVKIDEHTTYNMIIENTDTADVEVDALEISIPSGVEIVSIDRSLDRTGKTLSFSGEIRGEKTRTLWVELRGIKNGEFDIRMDADFSTSMLEFSKQLTKKIIVSESDIIPFLEISPHDVVSNGLYKMTAKLTNKLDTMISGIDATISGPVIKTVSFADEKLLEEETLTLVDTQYIVPEVAMPINLTVKLEGNYRDADTGNVYDFDTTDYLNIRPAEEIIKVRTEAPKGVSKGKDFEFSAYVNNLKSSILSDVSVASSIPKGVEIKGNPYGDINLGNLEEKEAFSLTLNVPATYESDVLMIETIANAEYKGDFVKESHTSRISLKGDISEPEKEQAEESKDKEEENADGKAEEDSNKTLKNVSFKAEKEEGFFGRIWSWIKGLFT